jgi:hypothetical protein
MRTMMILGIRIGLAEMFLLVYAAITIGCWAEAAYHLARSRKYQNRLLPHMADASLAKAVQSSRVGAFLLVPIVVIILLAIF